MTVAQPREHTNPPETACPSNWYILWRVNKIQRKKPTPPTEVSVTAEGTRTGRLCPHPQGGRGSASQNVTRTDGPSSTGFAVTKHLDIFPINKANVFPLYV